MYVVRLDEALDQVPDPSTPGSSTVVPYELHTEVANYTAFITVICIIIWLLLD